MATLRVTCFALLAASLLAKPAIAQDDAKPLNLKPQPSIGFPAAAVASSVHDGTPSSGAKPASTESASVNTAPGVYYGDTSGATVASATANDPNDASESCDDASYNKPQVHGTVGMGVVAGNHVSGSYQAGTVNITQPLGTCKHPAGNLSVTVGGSQSHFDPPRRRH